MTLDNYYYRKWYPLIDRSGGPDACWPWTGTRTRGGYGRLGAAYAHRLAWAAANGPIPAGLDICHTCDNPPCCNPAHLWAGTARDNLRDAAAKGRLVVASRTGEESTYHKLTWAAVRDIRSRFGTESQRSLARRHGVSQPTIHHIVTGKTWPERTRHNVSDLEVAS